MKTLTKKYRIIYCNGIISNQVVEYPEGSVSYIGKDMSSAEFDTLEDTENYIKENDLTYEYSTENN